MTDKKYGICDVNHIHREIPPVIHVHNKTPFSDYDTAVTELKKNILHPGEIVVVYYHDATADDGISTVIATGPLQQGGYNEIFKNANQIDDLVIYLKDLIKAQNGNVTDLAESLRQQIISEVEEIKKNTINEVEDRLNSSLGAFESNVTATLGTFEENIGKSLDSSIKDLKKMGLYYNRPASELMFLHPYEHQLLHKNAKKMMEKLLKQSNNKLLNN